MTPQPLVALSPDGEASILSYNVPEPTSYTGRNLIELVYDAAIFKDLTGNTLAIDIAELDRDLLDHLLTMGTVPAVHGTARPASAARGRGQRQSTPKPQSGDDGGSGTGSSSGPTMPDVPAGTPDTNTDRPPLVEVGEAQVNLAAGLFPVIISTQSGQAGVEWAPIPTEPKPGIYLVETFRLSNFLGDYGAGRTVKTFSLLPGERSHISITTYKNVTTTTTSASSIFDSYTEDTADEFESSIQSENSATDSQEKTKAWSVEAEASGNWGVASVSASAGASGSSNSAREEFAKNVTNATEKHSAAASAQRDIQVNTSTEALVEEGEETAIEREIENINLSRTLNFVFRQMNQEHLSLLHLVDVRVGFFNGFPDTRMEVPLYDIDRLLEYCVRTADDRERVKADVLYAVREIRDWRGDTHDDFVLVKEYEEADGTKTRFPAINREKTSELEGFTIPGLLLGVSRNVLRTDGVIVEAIMGQGVSLDGYSLELQEEKVAERKGANELMRLAAAKERLAQEIAAAGDPARAHAFQAVFGAPPEPVAAGTNGAAVA